MSNQLSFSVANILSGCVPPRFPQREKLQVGNHHLRSWSLSSCDSMDIEICADARGPSVAGKLASPPLSPVSTASAPSPITDVVSDELREELGGSQSDHFLEQESLAKQTSTRLSQRRGRMRFSPEQIQTLERRFQEQHYLLPADRKLLAAALRMTERQVKTWFQNKRAQYKRSRCALPVPIFYPMFPPGCLQLQATNCLQTLPPIPAPPPLPPRPHPPAANTLPMLIAATAVYPTSPLKLNPTLANPIYSQPLTTLHLSAGRNS